MLGRDSRRREAGVHLLCLPELCITGYGCEDAFHAPGVQRTALQVLGEIVPATQGLVVSVGLPIMHRGSLFNAACLIADRRIAGFVAKQNLAGEGIHYEPRWFKPWPADTLGRAGTGRPALSAGRPGVLLRRRADRFRDLRGRLGRGAARQRTGPGGGRRDPQPQRQSLRVRQARRSGSGLCWKDRARSR